MPIKQTTKLISKLSKLRTQNSVQTEDKPDQCLDDLYLHDLEKAQELLEGLTVQVLDKNKNQLWVECPVLTYYRIHNEIILNTACFTPTELTEKDVLKS